MNQMDHRRKIMERNRKPHQSDESQFHVRTLDDFETEDADAFRLTDEEKRDRAEEWRDSHLRSDRSSKG
jgi:hypothetical protein